MAQVKDLMVAEDARILGDLYANNFSGTNGSTAGKQGLVPAPATSDANKYLKSDGTWATPPGGTYTAGDNIDITNNIISVVGEPLKFITSGDCNMWELDDGIYYISASVNLYYDQHTVRPNISRVIILFSPSTSGYKIYYEFQDGNINYTGQTTQSYNTYERMFDISGKVNKSGDTMTGALAIRNASDSSLTLANANGSKSVKLNFDSSLDRLEFNFI